MKVKYTAVLLSLCAVALPIHADTSTKEKPPIVKSSAASHKININKADINILVGSVKGIGRKRAQAIIAYREEHKGFKSLDELADVKGFGQGFLNKNRVKLQEVFEVD